MNYSSRAKKNPEDDFCLLASSEPENLQISPGRSKSQDKSWEGRYLEGQGDLLRRLISCLNHIVNLLMPIIHLLTKVPLTLRVSLSG